MHKHTKNCSYCAERDTSNLVMPFFWDSFDYEPAEQPVAPPLEAWWVEGPPVHRNSIWARMDREERFDAWPEDKCL